MPIRTWVGRFSIVDGQPQEEGPLLRSFPRQRPDEDEDELYVLAEPASPAAPEHCAQLVDAIGRVYRDDTLSMTGATLRAIKTAQQQLRDWNQRSLREHRVAAGVSCLAVRDRSAYLAQIGPAIAYHVGDGRFQQVVPEGSAAAPLGDVEPIEPTFHRYHLSPGDLLLVASPRLEALADEETLRAILLRGGDEALVELFRLTRGERELSLVLLACVVEPEGEEQTAPPVPRFLQPGEAPSERPAAIAERAQAVPEEERHEPEPLQAERAKADEHPAIELGPARSEAETTTPSRQDPEARGKPEPAPRPPTGLSRPRVRLKGAEAEVRYGRPSGPSVPRVPALLVVAVAALIVAGLLAWLVIPSALEESQADRFNSLVDDARASLDIALQSDDPAEQRAALRDAGDALRRAESLRPAAPVLAELRQQVDAQLAELDAVVELGELELVVDVSERVPGPVSSRDLALGGGGAYFLDREEGRVIAVSLLAPEPEPFVLFAGGDLVGDAIAGQPRTIAWADDLTALLILDDQRQLSAVTPPGEPRRVLTVRDAESWGSADSIAHRDGRLYVLDRDGDQIWVYPPTDSGFDSERRGAVGSLDLEQAVEIAVGDAIYVVMGDDSIVRIGEGGAGPFAQAGIDVPLVSPASLTVLPDTGRVFVVDRGNSRIVEFTADGTFQQQFVSPTFTDLRSIAVDEGNGLLYILVGGALYRTPLPALP